MLGPDDAATTTRARPSTGRSTGDRRRSSAPDDDRVVAAVRAARAPGCRSPSAAAATASPATRSPTARWSSTCARCAASSSIRSAPGPVGGGALWDDVDGATIAHGLATTGGTFGDTGVGGLTLTGGLGFLMGTGGLTCDNLMRPTVVTADGTS